MESKKSFPQFLDAQASNSSTGIVGAQFTATQWKELQRQTLVYEYMMASVPVPSELLIPINDPLQKLNTSSSSQDNEPWRCKRTDGKKWRCSRDVAPDQKYCERHSHKSRPRSRKPVELQLSSKMCDDASALKNPRGGEWLGKCDGGDNGWNDPFEIKDHPGQDAAAFGDVTHQWLFADGSGGPLAEALCLNVSKADSAPSSSNKK